MPAITHVFTIQRVAGMLGQTEGFLWQLSDDMEPGDGMPWIYDSGDAQTRAFTHDGIEALGELLKD